MQPSSRILLQTTIAPNDDDWHIGRFSLLRDYLAGLCDSDGRPLFEVTARDREPLGAADSVLSQIDTSPFDQLWLFAVDTGDGLTSADCEAITRFRRRGGGLLLRRLPGGGFLDRLFGGLLGRGLFDGFFYGLFRGFRLLGGRLLGGFQGLGPLRSGSQV